MPSCSNDKTCNIIVFFTDVLLGGVTSPKGTNFDEMALSDSPFELK